MKILFLTTVFCFMSLIVSAQKIQFTDAPSELMGRVGDELSAAIEFRSDGDKPASYRIVLVEQQIGASQELKLCWGDDCFEDVAELPISVTIIPEEVVKNLRISLKSGQFEGFSSAVIRVENVDNPAEYYDHEINFRIDNSIKETLFSSGSMMIGTVYPNPVREIAMIDYRMKDDSKEVKIVLHNVLGSVVNEFKLSPFERQLKFYTSDFNPGVYFYTLYIDNDGITTKKMVVRH